MARQAKYKIVILEAFGLGGLPSETNGLLKEISELCRNGILVIVTTQCSHGQCDMTVYKVGQEALKCGVVCADTVSYTHLDVYKRQVLLLLTV